MTDRSTTMSFEAAAGSKYLEENEGGGHDHGGTAKGTWSQLPILLLWMVMERLQFIDNLHVAAVCKHWHYASTTCPTSMDHQAANDRLPWLMSVTKSLQWNGHLFNFLNGKRYKIRQFAAIYGAFALASKKGWLLLARPRVARTYPTPSSPSSSLFLLNPFARTTIQLPKVGTAGEAAISTVNGTPNCVAVTYGGTLRDRSTHVILELIHPNNEHQWRFYEHDMGEGAYVGHLSIISDEVCVGDIRGGHLFRFNMIDCTWTQVINNNVVLRKDDQRYILESDGTVMMIILREKKCDRGNDNIQMLPFQFLSYKLNANKTAWVKLSIDEEMQGKRLFLYAYSNRHLGHIARQLSFVANVDKSKSTQVCQLHIVNDDGGDIYVDVYNLESQNGEVQARWVSRKPLATDCVWVDLG